MESWASLKVKRLGLNQKLYSRESSDYCSYLSQSNKYLLSRDTQHTLRLMLHTALEMSVISVMFPHLHDWEGLCCLSARAAIFLMVLSRGQGLITHSEPQDWQINMQSPRERGQDYKVRARRGLWSLCNVFREQFKGDFKWRKGAAHYRYIYAYELLTVTKQEIK